MTRSQTANFGRRGYGIGGQLDEPLRTRPASLSVSVPSGALPFPKQTQFAIECGLADLQYPRGVSSTSPNTLQHSLDVIQLYLRQGMGQGVSGLLPGALSCGKCGPP